MGKKNKKAKLNSNATGLVPFTGSESSGRESSRRRDLKVKEINVAIGLRSMFDWP